MTLDSAITIAAISAATLALFWRSHYVAPLFILMSHISHYAIYPSSYDWHHFESWLYTLIIKDLILISLFGFMRGRHSFILMLTFVATCVFHQLILAQALTGKVDNLTLLAVRPDLMKFIVICQLSTVYHAILTGGGSDGGKRAKCNLLFSDHRRHQFFCQQTLEIKR